MAMAAKVPAEKAVTPKKPPATKVANLLVLKEGFKVDGRWTVTKLLGKGSFGAVYKVQDCTKVIKGLHALKSESTKCPPHDQVLKIEVAVLKAMAGCHHACKLYARGRNDKYSFIVMSILGKSLGDIRKKQPGEKMSMSTTCRIIFQCLKGVREMHNCDWIHRDVKPDNFAMGGSPTTRKVVYIFDFGLARRYRNNNLDLRKCRTGVAFRGTKWYCSVGVHKKEEFGRHDDLISVLYMFVEFATGELPWYGLGGDSLALLKRKTELGATIYAGLPTFLPKVHEYLHSLKYDIKPNYAKFEAPLARYIYANNFHKEALDWEVGVQMYMTSAATAKNDFKVEGDALKSLDVKNELDVEPCVEKLVVVEQDDDTNKNENGSIDQ